MPRPDPLPAQKQPKAGYAALVAVAGAAAAAIMVPTVSAWEGKSNDPYADMIGKMTVCFGETRVEMRRYSDAECNEMLAGGLAGFTSEVLTCTPSLRGRGYALAATVSLTYNIGAANYCRSSVDRRFDAGDIRGGCNAMLMWNKAGGRVVRGLARRREAERAICLRDAA